jgi:hypothetical protein
MDKDTIKINLKWFKDFLIIVKLFFNTKYWIMNESYSAKWDKELNSLMNTYDFKKMVYESDYVVKLGEREIWVANHPYASFTDYSDNRRIYGRPSRLTIYKAKQKLEIDRKKQILTQENNIITNPCSEINLGSDDEWPFIRGGKTFYRNSSSIMIGTRPEVGDLNNGIPRNWDDEI